MKRIHREVDGSAYRKQVIPDEAVYKQELIEQIRHFQETIQTMRDQVKVLREELAELDD